MEKRYIAQPVLAGAYRPQRPRQMPPAQKIDRAARPELGAGSGQSWTHRLGRARNSACDEDKTGGMEYRTVVQYTFDGQRDGSHSWLCSTAVENASVDRRPVHRGLTTPEASSHSGNTERRQMQKQSIGRKYGVEPVGAYD
jgi:hypothetical protein